MIIIVNGVEIRFRTLRMLSFDEVVRLAGKPVGPLYTVTYKKAGGQKTEGSMRVGDVVKIKDGTIF